METLSCDLLVIGAGAAGTFAAVTAAKQGARVIVASKDPVGTGNTMISGGIVSCAGVLPEDSPERFADDILRCGRYINNKALVDVVTRGSMLSNRELESWGHIFSRDANGQISPDSIIQAGGHSIARTLTCAQKGLSISLILRSALAAKWRGEVELVEDASLISLLLSQGAAAGARFFHLPTGKTVEIRARKTVLATGGAGMLWYPHTDNMRGATGEGYALAYLAGCRLVDMEHVQWIPFGIVHPESMVGMNCGEPATAGPEGILLNGRGEIVLDRGLNRMTRAQVTRAIVKEVHEGRGSPHGGLWLDMRGNQQTEAGRRNLANWRKIGGGGPNPIRIAYGPAAAAAEVPFEVAPTEHYFTGGVVIDEWGRTDIPNLFAAGEAAGGIHGADRLGSVALSECMVFGTRVGWTATETLGDSPVGRVDEIVGFASGVGLFGRTGTLLPGQLKLAIGRLMWEKVGTLRTAASLEAALEELTQLRASWEQLQIPGNRTQNRAVVEAMETNMMLLTAEMVTRSALARAESRGGHYRLDIPEESDYWQERNIFVRKAGNQMEITAVQRRETREVYA